MTAWNGDIYRPLPDRLGHLSRLLADRPPVAAQSRVHVIADDDVRASSRKPLDVSKVAAVTAASVFDLAGKL